MSAPLTLGLHFQHTAYPMYHVHVSLQRRALGINDKLAALSAKARDEAHRYSGF